MSVYNFTIYDPATNNGFCFLWHEAEGQRGANEIGSVLYIYLKECLKSSVKHVVITTDSTVSQNRNHLVAGMLLLAAQTLPLESIEQKFLETGHTYMEVDSMHATIDSYRKNLKVYSPLEWPVILQLARRSQPYIVREIERNEFFDLHHLAKSMNTTSLKTKIPWMKVKCLRVQKGVTDAVEIKEDYDDAYKKVFLKSIIKMRKKFQ